jgi:outer membrane protein OmpA-like peptidoglycan-associated protein
MRWESLSTTTNQNGMGMLRRVVALFVGIIMLSGTSLAVEPGMNATLYSVSILTPPPQGTSGGILDDVKSIRIINLGPAINHEELDYGPTISADGKTLYFVSNRKGSRITRDGDFSHDFWSAKKANSNDTVFITIPMNIDTVDAGVNTVMNEGVANIAADRQTLYFTGCNRADGLGDCDIYVSEIQGDRWSTPRNLGRNVNSEYWDSQPSISPGQDRLYFVSNRPSPTNEDGGGQDDTDIWYCDWDEDFGEWKPAVNMGPDVNTSKAEAGPFIAADGITLFFSSNGHVPNMGGLDFYKTVKTGAQDRAGRDRWSKPEQLPAPINTKEDEQFISLPASGDVMYFSSRRRDLPGWQGNLDIFMAFIPSYFRAVNLIVDVIDECTGQHVPAALTYANPKTGKNARDSVSTTKTESSVIIADADYGAKAVREDSVLYTVTALSPTYGERSIVVPIYDPGKVRDRTLADSQIVIRKTIMLGRRPTLTAEMEFSEWSKKYNDGFKGLVIEERATITLYPLLPYVFFDLNSDKFPDRYTIFKSPNQTKGFNDERLPGATLQKYYHVLNIYGYRLNKYPNVKIEITGCVDETNEDKNSDLAKNRATIVHNYLRDIWGISEDRMKIDSRGWPKLRSNPKDSLGIVENRRAELIFVGSDEDVWQVSRPILDNDPTPFPTPEQMTWVMTNGIDSSIVASRRIEVWRSGKNWKVINDIGRTNSTHVWDWLDESGEWPQEERYLKVEQKPLPPYKAQLVVVSQNGTECRSDTVTIPVKRTSTSAMKITRGAEKTQEKYNLILFPFDSPMAGPMNERILKEYIYPRVKSTSEIYVDGKTDVVGMYEHNQKLSERRAQTVERGVRSIGSYKLLEARGTGEDEPLFSNDLPEGRFFNRTVQVRIQTPLEDAGIE